MTLGPLDRPIWYLGLAWRRLRSDPWSFPGAVYRQVRGWLPEALQPRGTKGLACGRLPAEAEPDAALADGARPDVSVVLPVKDQADLLGASIQSVLEQAGVRLELIVVDDGSEDAIDPVLRGAARDSRVRILRQPNRGLPGALSVGFRFVTGRYLTWTSADNLMQPGLLAGLTARLRQRREVTMVYADYRLIDADGAPLLGGTFRPGQRRGRADDVVQPPRSTVRLNVQMDNFIGPAFLYRRFVADCLGDWTGAMGIEDYDYWMRLNAAFRIEHAGEDFVRYLYRWHDNSLNGRAGQLRLLDRGKQLMRLEARRAEARARPWTLCVESGTVDSRQIDTVASPDSLVPFSRRGDVSGRVVWWLSPDDWVAHAAEFEDRRAAGAETEPVIDWRAASEDALARLVTVMPPGGLHVVATETFAERLQLITTRVVRFAPSDDAGAVEFVRALLRANQDVVQSDVPLPAPWMDGGGAAGPSVRVVRAEAASELSDALADDVDCVVIPASLVPHVPGSALSRVVCHPSEFARDELDAACAHLRNWLAAGGSAVAARAWFGLA